MINVTNLFQKAVEVLQLWSDEDEVVSVMSGENVKIKLKGVEEEVMLVLLYIYFFSLFFDWVFKLKTAHWGYSTTQVLFTTLPFDGF